MLVQVGVALVWAALGWGVGIVLNRLVYQIPRDRPLFEPPTCPHCGARVAAVSLYPLDRCTTCREPTGYDRSEWILAALFAMLAFWFGPTTSLFAHSLYLVALTVLGLIDLRHRYVYTIVSLPTLLGALLLSPLLAGLGIGATILGFTAGALVFAILYVVGRILYHGMEPMGSGDITIAAIIGAMVGFPRVLSALFVGSIASGLFGLAAMVVGGRGRRAFIPYGPGLCLGALVAFFIGP